MAAIPPSIDAAATTAVDALLKWKTKQSDSQNPQLLPQDDFIYLNLTLKKIPQKGSINGPRANPNKIPLPHPIVSTNFSEICLIIDDRPTSKLTSAIAKKKIKEEGISVTKVLKLSKLRTDYKPFEAKRKLCDSYDMFFADKRVVTLLPKLLGKWFFKKKKLPLGVDLSHKNWKEQIERGCGSGLLWFGTGTCSVVRVAKVSMERDEIVENVKAAIAGAIGFVGKKLGGVRSLHLKLADSVALPVYQSLPDVKLRIEGVRVECLEGVEEVEKDGEKKKKKSSKKGRIHEMDLDVNEVDEPEVENENDENVDDGSDGGLGKKKRKGDGIEVGKKTKKKSKKGKGVEVEVSRDSDDEVVEEVKPAKKSVKEKKRKGDVMEESNVSARSSDKIAKKKGKKVGDSGKKEKKKKGRSVSRV
ncbi:putative ribosomal protein L1 [Helianthus annuus]|nr:putative ribosomal protein L1 [Helianthus annuus]KAJ0846068.1 putative ribosomal protein L1 [Helianthus annuus]